MSPQLDTQPKSNQTVTVSLVSQKCVIEPAQPELSFQIYTKRHQPFTNGPHAGQVVCGLFPLIFEQEDNAGTPISSCYAGLAPLVVQQLKRNGVQVQFKNKNRSSLKGPRYFPYDLFEEPDEAVLGFMQRHERGIILHAPKLANVARILAQIAYAFPNKSILVAVTRKTDAWKLRNQIVKLLHARVVSVATSGTNLKSSSRVIIGTYTQLAQGFIGIERRDLLFSLNPDEMLANYFGKETINAAHKARFDGFLPRNKKIVTYFKHQLLALFGTNRISIPVPGKVERPVQVLFNRFFHYDPLKQFPRNPWQLKRQELWEHTVRNDLIVSIASGLTKQDRNLLTPVLSKQIRFNKKSRIGILVDNVDHAARLGKRLKGWIAVMGPVFCTERNLLPEIGAIAAELGLRESFSLAVLEELWHTSWITWETALQTAVGKYDQIYGSNTHVG
ncbi:MAG: hypothetical protein COA78_11395 [Blastopirellula sp.]|nr:MAG: hypothetical protein COA78_11395 [Blastopirellula sp.]